MIKIFCVEFQRYPLKFHTKYLICTLKDMILYNIEILRALRFKSSYTFLKRPPDLYVLALEMLHSWIYPSVSCCNPSHCSIVHLVMKYAGTETVYHVCGVNSFHNPEPIAMWVGWQIRLCFLAHCSACLHENAAWPPKSHYLPNTICVDEGISIPTL